MIDLNLIGVLSGSELKVLLYLMYCKGTVQITQNDLGFAINVSERQVRVALRNLQRMELIDYTSHNGKVKGIINVRVDNFDCFYNMSETTTH